MNDQLWLEFKGTGGPGAGKHIVMVSGDEEYRSEEALPLMARSMNALGLECVVLFSQDSKTGKINPDEPTHIPGLEHIIGADLLVLQLRFRELTDEHMKFIVDHVEAGKPIVGIPHICNDNGDELPIGEVGTIWFEGDSDFSYHNDEEKTKESRHKNNKNWSTLGDVGKLDKDGYLYLTDRKAFMIISGGVNIYPQETENLLVTHPKVADCAVIGVPNEEFGEEVKAIIEPINWAEANEDLEEELINFCKNNLSSIKCPRSIDFEKELPRHPTGKLYKRLLKDRYWGKKDSKIV